MARVAREMAPPIWDSRRLLVARVGHQPQHLFHRCFQTDEQSSADDAMTDVELDEVRHAVEQWQVLVIQTVAGIDF